MTAIDFSILDFIQAHLRNAFCDLIMPQITVLGNAGVLWILLTLALLCIPRTRRLGITLTAALIMLGGFVIGLIYSFSSAYISSSLASTFVYLILIVVLLIKPAGILGKNVGEKV